MKTLDTLHPLLAVEAGESRLARSIAARLSERADSAPADIGERLRFAREKALVVAQRSRPTETAGAIGVTAGGAAVAGFSRSSWWLRIASVVPLVALVAGLVMIEKRERQEQISVAAEVDAALLGDDLPINAYRDAGFAEFLRGSAGE